MGRPVVGLATWQEYALAGKTRQDASTIRCCGCLGRIDNPSKHPTRLAVQWKLGGRAG